MKKKKQSILKHRVSKFYSNLNTLTPLNYYPRPYLQRSNWTNLNGQWDYKLVKNIGLESLTTLKVELPSTFDGKILVPFALETFASNVNKVVRPEDIIWYQRTFEYFLEDDYRLILNFEKVDQEAKLYINSKEVGLRAGGYLSFSFDITPYINKGVNTLTLLVKDYTNYSCYSIGKQSLEHKGIFYTPSSGIYDTVWLEQVPKDYIKDISFTTSPSGMVYINSTFTGKQNLKIEVENHQIELKDKYFLVKDVRLWSIDDPYLYKVKITYGIDTITSYFSFRTISKVEVNSHKYIAINNKPLIINGVLDQGYYSSSGMTPTSLEELIYDITAIKELGYNTIRKHLKIESRRFYYECDRLGILVIQDMPCVYRKLDIFKVGVCGFLGIRYSDEQVQTFSSVTPKMIHYFTHEVRSIIISLRNHPSIITWTLFNEGWGQFSTELMTTLILSLDKSRLIDSNSGWFDQGQGDFHSIHRYIIPYKSKKDKLNRIQFLSECGGLTLKLNGYESTNLVTGYKKYKDIPSISKAYNNLYSNQFIPSLDKGLAGIIYTQLSDVEDELNGIFTFDRKVLKIDPQVIKANNQIINNYFNTKQTTKEDNK